MRLNNRFSALYLGGYATAGSASNSIYDISISTDKANWESIYSSAGWVNNINIGQTVYIPPKYFGEYVFFRFGVKQGGTSTVTRVVFNTFRLTNADIYIWPDGPVGDFSQDSRIIGTSGFDNVASAVTKDSLCTTFDKISIVHSATAGSAGVSEFTIYGSPSLLSPSWTEIYTLSSYAFSDRTDIIDIPDKFKNKATYYKFSVKQGGTSTTTVWSIKTITGSA